MEVSFDSAPAGWWSDAAVRWRQLCGQPVDLVQAQVPAREEEEEQKEDDENELPNARSSSPGDANGALVPEDDPGPLEVVVSSIGEAQQRPRRRLCGKTKAQASEEAAAAARKRRRTTMLGRPMTPTRWAKLVRSSLEARPASSAAAEAPAAAPRGKLSPSLGGPPPRPVGSWPGGGASPSSPSSRPAGQVRRRWLAGSFDAAKPSRGGQEEEEESHGRSPAAALERSTDASQSVAQLLAVATPPRSRQSSSMMVLADSTPPGAASSRATASALVAALPAWLADGRGSRTSVVAEDLPDTLWQDFRAWSTTEH